MSYLDDLLAGKKPSAKKPKAQAKKPALVPGSPAWNAYMLTHIKNSPQPFTTGNGGLMDWLMRPHQATQALETRGPGAAWDAILHGVSPAQDNADRANVRTKIPFFQQIYSHVPHPVQGVMDFALDTVNDPTTYLPLLDAGKLLNMGSKVDRAVSAATPLSESALPAIQKAAAALRTHFPNMMANIEPVASQVHNFFTMGGAADANALRTMARTNGLEGVVDANKTRGLRLAANAQGENLTATLKKMFNDAIQGLSDKEQKQVFTAIHFGRVGKLPEALQPIANRVVQITRSIPALRGTKPLLKKLAAMGHTLPSELDQFLPAAPRGIQKVSQFMTNYLPMLKDDDPEFLHLIDSLGIDNFGKKDLAAMKDAHLLPRPIVQKLLGDAQTYRNAMDSVFSSAGRSIASHDLKQGMLKEFAPVRPATRSVPLTPEQQVAADAQGLTTINDPAKRLIKTAMTKEDFAKLSPTVRGIVTPKILKGVTGTRRYADIPLALREMLVNRGSRLPAIISDMPEGPTKSRLIMELMKKNAPKEAFKNLLQPYMDLVNAQKAAMFYQPLGHMRNIGTLAAVHDPTLLPEILKNYAKSKFGLAAPEDIQKQFAGSIRAGAASAPNMDVTEARKALNDIAGMVGQGATKVNPALGKVVNAVGGAAGKVYDTSSKMLWGFDNAAKDALFKKYQRQMGSTPLAAWQAQRDLIHYGERSPFTNAVSKTPLAPFANYRTQMPLSVLRAIRKNPKYALAISRILGGLFAGGTTTIGGKKRSGYTPLGETNLLTQGGPGIQKYIRASLGPTGKIAANALMQAFNHSPHESNYSKHWWMYGQGYPSFALHSVPPFNDLMQYTGHGMFKSSPSDEALYNLTGIQTYEH